jgi:hypothetical protein
MSINSIVVQSELNLTGRRFALARQQTTQQVRLILELLTGERLTAQEVLKQGKKGCLKLSSPFGLSIVTADLTSKNSRCWRWSIDFIPTIFNS